PIFKVVEHHITEATAKNYPKGTVGNEIFNLGAGDHRLRSRRAVQRYQPRADKSTQIHYSVPVNLERANRQRYWIKARMHHHRMPVDTNLVACPAAYTKRDQAYGQLPGDETPLNKKRHFEPSLSGRTLFSALVTAYPSSWSCAGPATGTPTSK